MFDLARGGRLSVTVIRGEAGIGKTALVTCFIEEISDSGATVCWGRCWQGEDATAFWPWRQMIRDADDDQDGTALDDWLESEPTPHVDATDVDRLRRFQTVTDYLYARSKQAPLVLVIDDLHWADPASLALIRYLVTDPCPLRLQLVVTTPTPKPSRRMPHERWGRLFDSSPRWR